MSPDGSGAAPRRLAHHDIGTYDAALRTTLELDDAVLDAARTVARQTRRSVGAVISEWARRGVGRPSTSPASTSAAKRGRIPTFEVGPRSPPINADVVKVPA